jgi:hypothetical protein
MPAFGRKTPLINRHKNFDQSGHKTRAEQPAPLTKDFHSKTRTVSLRMWHVPHCMKQFLEEGNGWFRPIFVPSFTTLFYSWRRERAAAENSSLTAGVKC